MWPFVTMCIFLVTLTNIRRFLGYGNGAHGAERHKERRGQNNQLLYLLITAYRRFAFEFIFTLLNYYCCELFLRFLTKNVLHFCIDQTLSFVCSCFRKL